jgi:hypothetical protein
MRLRFTTKFLAAVTFGVAVAIWLFLPGLSQTGLTTYVSGGNRSSAIVWAVVLRGDSPALLFVDFNSLANSGVSWFDIQSRRRNSVTVRVDGRRVLLPLWTDSVVAYVRVNDGPITRMILKRNQTDDWFDSSGHPIAPRQLCHQILDLRNRCEHGDRDSSGGDAGSTGPGGGGEEPR